MENIYISCINDNQKEKKFFIIEVEKNVLNKLNMKTNEKIVFLMNKKGDRGIISKAHNGYCLKKINGKKSYEFSFYLINENVHEFLKKRCNYFIKKNYIQVFL